MSSLTLIEASHLFNRADAAEKELERRLYRVPHGRGVRARWLPLLAWLADNPDSPICMLAAHTGNGKRTNLSYDVKRLFDLGLILVAETSHDSRVKLLSLSPSGRALLAALEGWGGHDA